MEREKAIAHVKDMYAHMIFREDKEALETLIPELKESEDERIRKAILGLTYLDGIEPILTKCSITAGDIRTYLEKQNHDGKKWLTPAELNRLETLHYEAGFDAGVRSEKEKQKEQNPAEVDESTKRLNDNWMKQHFDDYEEQKSAQSREEILHQLFQNGSISLSDYLYLTGEQKPAEWSEEDTEMYINVASSLRGYACGLENEEHKKHIKKGLDWLENRFKSLRPEPKQEWSEEDEKNLELIIDCIYTFYPDPVMKYKLKDWLKSLRPSWKPSEEQMGAFCRCVDYLEESDNEDADIMAELYEQLKQL